MAPFFCCRENFFEASQHANALQKTDEIPNLDML